MVKNPGVVYDKAEEMAAKYREQMKLQQQGGAPAAVVEAVAEPEAVTAEDVSAEEQPSDTEE
jgi:small subunit ribosomal protein S1